MCAPIFHRSHCLSLLLETFARVYFPQYISDSIFTKSPCTGNCDKILTPNFHISFTLQPVKIDFFFKQMFTPKDSESFIPDSSVTDQRNEAANV